MPVLFDNLKEAERRGEHREAMRLLDRAGALFQQHRAVLYLKQVLAKKQILGT